MNVLTTTFFDFDGDGRSDISVFRPSEGNWYANQSRAGFLGLHFGQSGDQPVPADYDGDGKADIAVFRGGTWYRLLSGNGTFDGVNFGLAGDRPVPGDFDGDGKADVAVFRPSDGNWYQMLSATGSVFPGPFRGVGGYSGPGRFRRRREGGRQRLPSFRGELVSPEQPRRLVFRAAFRDRRGQAHRR